jgi:hypothetical protein
MPTVKRQAPLLEEGEYCGQARKVTQDWTKPKPNPDGSKTEPVCRFVIPLSTHNGKSITTFARVTESTGWVFEQMCKSGNMQPPPDGSDFQITCDDLENRVFYFGVEHNKLSDGRIMANVKFHTKTYAIQQNPELANVSFPNTAPPIVLRSAVPSAPPPEEPPGSVAKSSGSPPPSVPPAEVKPTPEAAGPEGDLSGISEEEFREALAYAKRLQKEKGTASDPKAQAAA